MGQKQRCRVKSVPSVFLFSEIFLSVKMMLFLISKFSTSCFHPLTVILPVGLFTVVFLFLVCFVTFGGYCLIKLLALIFLSSLFFVCCLVRSVQCFEICQLGSQTRLCLTIKIFFLKQYLQALNCLSKLFKNQGATVLSSINSPDLSFASTVEWIESVTFNIQFHFNGWLIITDFSAMRTGAPLLTSELSVMAREKLTT